MIIITVDFTSNLRMVINRIFLMCAIILSTESIFNVNTIDDSSDDQIRSQVVIESGILVDYDLFSNRTCFAFWEDKTL